MPSGSPAVKAPTSDCQWFAVRTAFRHETRVNNMMAERRLETFLPVYQTERKWKKRPTTTAEIPLFPSYLFVRISNPCRSSVLSVPGVLSIVGNGKNAIPVRETEIDTLRAGLHLRKAEPHPYLTVGQRTRIKNGPLAGLEGIMVREKSSLRVVIAIELIMQSISVEVDIADLEDASCLANTPELPMDWFSQNSRSFNGDQSELCGG